MRAGRPRQRCVTCTPSDWRAIQALAQEAGMGTSAYVLDRVLGDVRRVALAPEAQRAQHERVSRLVLLCEDLLRPLPGTEVTLAEAVAFLYRDRRAAGEAAAVRRGARSPSARDARVPDLFGGGSSG